MVTLMDRQRLTDTEARQLLERAAELDAEQAHSLDIATVREIAAEAGISPAAVDAALRENAERRPPAVARWSAKRRIRAVSRVLLVPAIAYVVIAFVQRIVF